MSVSVPTTLNAKTVENMIVKCEGSSPTPQTNATNNPQPTQHHQPPNLWYQRDFEPACANKTGQFPPRETVLSNPTARLRPQTSNTPGILQTKNPTPTKTVHTCIYYPPDPISYFPASSSAHSGARTQPEPRPPKGSRVPIDTLKPCVCPQASSAPKYSTLDDRQFTPRSPGSVPLRARKRPYRGFSSAWSFRPWVQAPLGTSLPRASPRRPPHIYLGAGLVLWNKRVWISKWPPPLMRSLLSSSHVIKRASLTVSPGIPIIIANQCSGVHHLCGVVTIRASTSSPARAQDPITTSQVPPDESRYGGPGRSV
jgi:hypothetical protein